MAGEGQRNDQDVVSPERTHDQPAEGGREQADQAVRSRPGDSEADPTPDPEAEGIVDQQGAALRQQRSES